MDVDDLLRSADLADVSVDTDRALAAAVRRGRGRRRRRAAVLSVCALLVVGVFVALGLANRDDPSDVADGPTSTIATSTTSRAGEGAPPDGYPLSQDVRSAAAFIGNTRVVVGKVTHVSDPFTPTLPKEVLEAAGEEGDSANKFVSRRVSVEISNVLRGDGTAGDVIDLRIFGGDGAPAPGDFDEWDDVLEPGFTVAVFGGDPVTYEGAITMLTPNHLFIESGGLFRPTTPGPGPVEAFTLDELVTLVQAAG